MTQWLNIHPLNCLEPFRLRSRGMNATASRANQLERRLISFAAAVVSLSSKLPRTPQGRHICGQILRSGTAAAANYGEAQKAEPISFTSLKSCSRNSTKQPYGWKSLLKVPCFRRKTLSRLSRKTANFAELSRPPSRRLGRRQNDGPLSPLNHWVIRSISQLHYTAHNSQ